MGDTLTAGQTWAVVIVGIVVVFVILLILVGLCTGMSRLLHREKKTPPPEKKEEAPVKEAPVPEAKAEEGVSGEVIAAISAAVACILGPDKKFVVRSIKRQKSGRTAWNAAGVAENTRPF